jgi:alkylated DNA repair dioxygenase AlkB
MTPTVELLRQRVSAHTGIEFNHSVVLLYRDGNDCIGYHKDKLLDLDESSPIVSISFGYARSYHLRDNHRNPTMEYSLTLSQGGMLVLGAQTNKDFYHSVPLSPPEMPTTPRVSVTFRKTMTFLNERNEILGKGKEYQSPNWPVELRGVHHYDDEEKENEEPQE